jgi:hypothetical protein
MPRTRKPKWKDGPLLVRRGHQTYHLPAEGAMAVPEHTIMDEGTFNAVAYGTGLALLVDEAVEQLANGLVLRIAVRDGRPQLVAIESPDSEHPITKRSLSFPVKKLVKTMIRDATVRLERDPLTGDVFGLRVTSATGAGDIRPLATRAADVDKTAWPARPGRPPLSDDFLRQIVTEWNNAQAAGGSASVELGTRHHVQASTVRQWMFKARARGLA